MKKITFTNNTGEPISADNLNAIQDNVEQALKEMKESIFAIGDLFITMNDTSPAERFGGVWKLVGKGKTLVGVDESDNDFKTVGKTGGSKTNTHYHSIGDSLTNTDQTSGPCVVNRGNNTSNTTISIVQPYLTCYFWQKDSD